MSVTGYGRAEKGQVKTMVESVLRCGEVQVSSFDASDALAVAICHAMRGINQAALGKVVARRTRERPSMRPRQSNWSGPTA
jgi:Holliday junction resolvasome RuvABC endonuclease subunit